MKIDCHTHGKLAKYLPFSVKYTQWLFREAILAGLDGICLTEHFNTLGFNEVYHYIGETFPREGDCFLFETLRIFPGMEIDIAQGNHIVVIGTMEDIILLRENLEPYSKKGDYLPFDKLMEMIGLYPVLAGFGHPFRGGIPELPEEVMKKLDYIELNGKDIALNRAVTMERTQALGERLGLPVVAGSDTHQSLQYGCICNRFAEQCTTIGHLRSLIDKRSYGMEISDMASVQVRGAVTLKRALKEVHALGGDYVSILVDS